jgi:hypothetical protein
MPLLCGPRGLWSPWPAWPTTSTRGARRWASWTRLWGPGAGRAGRRVRRRPLGVWCGGPVRIRHHPSSFGRRLLTVVAIQPVEILVAPRRHVSKGTWGQGSYCPCLLSAPESRLVGVASARKPRAPHILAGIFPEIPSPPADERLPRCQFAPRMLHRARRPRFPHVSSEVHALKDAEV